MTAEYRTPEEEQQQDAHEAVEHGASVLLAIELDEPEDVITLWVDRLWNGLRDQLSDDHPEAPDSRLRPDEDRLQAIVMLLTGRMHDKAQTMLRGLGDA